VSQFEQQLVEDGGQEARPQLGAHSAPEETAAAVRAARQTLKAQIAKLEHELSALVADGFPFLCAPLESRDARRDGPRLPDLAELTGEKDLVRDEREELQRQVEQAQAAAKQNEQRAIKAYQKMKGDEKLREKTRKALQIALALLDNVSLDVDAESEKESA